MAERPALWEVLELITDSDTFPTLLVYITHHSTADVFILITVDGESASHFSLLTRYDEIIRRQDIYSLYLKTSGKNTSGILVLVHIFSPTNPIKLSSLSFFPLYVYVL